ncbi:MAG: tetratricopeptide repeat protein [Chloroflexaceae bacterium]|nr:tetratricopeptide repeat protein [Chloroflexaceae bacterium]
MRLLREGIVPKHRWLLSLLTCASLWGTAVPALSQALLPYVPKLDTQQLEQQGLELAQDAIQLYRFRQYDLALPRAQLAAQLAPNLFQTWLVLGSLYVQQEEFEQAIAALDKARTLAPEDAKAQISFVLGDAYFQRGDYPSAIAQIQTGLKLEPEASEAWFNLGNAHLKQNQYSEAISAYQKAVQQEKEFWPALNNIGLIKYEQGDIKGALQQWQAALVIDSAQAEPQLAMAVALYAQGKREEGLKAGETALSIDPRYADLEFLQQNLWGDRLLRDTQALLTTPQIQAVLARLQEELPPIQIP